MKEYLHRFIDETITEIETTIKTTTAKFERTFAKKITIEITYSHLFIDFESDFLCILVLITDTLPIHHSFLQILNMLLGPLALFTCGVLLLVLSDTHHVRVIYSRLVDPIICCWLFLSYLLMIFVPSRRRIVNQWN